MIENPGDQRIQPRPGLGLFAGYHSPQVDVAVRLNTNEAPDPPPESLIAGVKAGLDSIALNRYPDRSASSLRAAIAELTEASFEQVFPANGSNEVLQAIMLAFGGPGRSVALFEPTYLLHSHIARITGSDLIIGSRESDMLISSQELQRVLDQNPSVTFICSPNNPTGRLESRDRIIEALAKAPGLVVVDEAYGQFANWSAVELMADNPHLVVVRTFSKTWSLAGLRLGYCLAGPEVISALWQVTLPYHLDSIKQLCGTIAVKDVASMKARVQRLVEERTRLQGELNSLGVEAVPSDANFILFRSQSVDASTLWKDLLAASVLVRDVSGFPMLDGWLRVTIGTREENDAFLQALRKASEKERP